MRVLYITTNFPRWQGDAHSPWIVEIIKRLRARGIECEVLAPSYAGLGDHRIEGFPVYRFRYAPAACETLTHNEGAPNKIRNPLYLLLVPTYLIAGLWRTLRLCRNGRYDVIHAHWPLPSGLFGAAGKALCGARLVASFHGAELLLARRFPLLKPILAAIIRRCDAVTANSRFTSDLVRTIADVPVHVVPFGSRIEPREMGTCDENGTHILFVGRLIERKGVRYLIQAMSQLHALIPGAHLDIVGDGAIREELARLAESCGAADCVTFHGRVDDAALAELYARCACFVLPSIVDSAGDTEGLGVVLLEAMSYSKPVIATRVGGIPDIVIDGENGLLVEEKDAAGLAAAMTRLLEDRDLAARLGAAGSASVRRRFGWDAIVDAIEALYRGEEPAL